MMTKERQTYDKEFKQKAVELSFARGNAREIAEELGIHPELLYRWRREHQKYQNTDLSEIVKKGPFFWTFFISVNHPLPLS